MPQVYVAGASPDYAGQSHTTIVGLLSGIRDTFVSAGWSVIADTISTTQDLTVQNAALTVFLRISYSSETVWIEGSRTNGFSTTSTKFNCGTAVDGDDTRLYMNCDDNVVGISCWSNARNTMSGSIAGYFDVFVDDTLFPTTWWIGELSSTGWMYAESSVWYYDSSEWMSWNVAHSNETTDIEVVGTYTMAFDGTVDIAVGQPYSGDNDVDNDRNAGYYFYNGRENGLDNNSALRPFYWKGGRNDTNGDDGDYGAGETKRGVEVNKQMYVHGYWERFVSGVASEDQRTIVTDSSTGYVYVVVGGFKYQGMRIA